LIAAVTASMTGSGSPEANSARSAPALSARTAAAGNLMPIAVVVAAMDSESVMMTVLSPVRPRRYVRALRERLAGVSSPVSPFERRCPTITSGTPAANACSNGTMSLRRSTDNEGTLAAPLCVSVAQP
jgi:hypothetical protein